MAERDVIDNPPLMCLGPFFHRWNLWMDGDMTFTRLLTMSDGVPAELWGTERKTTRNAQSRTCKDCGRKQIRIIR